MDDDLNTPDALAAVFDLVKDINTLSATSSKEALETAAAAFDEITGVLGLLYNRKKDEVPAEVTALVEKRAAAKKAKDVATADAIRAELTAMGWAVKDTAQGPQLSSCKAYLINKKGAFPCRKRSLFCRLKMDHGRRVTGTSAPRGSTRSPAG